MVSTHSLPYSFVLRQQSLEAGILMQIRQIGPVAYIRKNLRIGSHQDLQRTIAERWVFEPRKKLLVG
jgi:hypothetical protein